MSTGFWAFYLNGFDGWDGHRWGMPNNSTAQHWDTGPDGAPPHPAMAESKATPPAATSKTH